MKFNTMHDYIGLSKATAYIFQTFRNTNGDIAAPMINVWTPEMEESPYESWVMVGLIWSFWFINYQALHVLMLTFLNGVFGAKSEETMSRLERDIVWTMATMNRDHCLVLKSLSYLGIQRPLSYLGLLQLEEPDLADIQYIARTESDDVVLDSFTSQLDHYLECQHNLVTKANGRAASMYSGRNAALSGIQNQLEELDANLEKIM